MLMKSILEFHIIPLCFPIVHYILMQLGINDMLARGYNVAGWILNICINYGNQDYF